VSSEKPEIKNGITSADLHNYYYSDELVAFCNKNGVKSSGTKKDLIKRIIGFFVFFTISFIMFDSREAIKVFCEEINDGRTKIAFRRVTKRRRGKRRRWKGRGRGENK
jgi:hypothetical protein